MSWSSPMRVLGVCGVWLAIQTGCGGNPSVSTNDPGTNGGSSNGGAATSGTGGLIISTGGDDNTGGDDDKPTTYVCGNRELEPGELCEDGNTADDDGCSGDCATTDPEYDCSAIGEECVRVVICGNGVIEGDEACDDGGRDDDDGCAADCKVVEDGWACVRPGQPCVGLSVCGNGVRERGEACDDGQFGAGCDDQCQLEAGYECPTPGMECSQLVCGDGVRTRDEACDDGAIPPVAGDGCSTTCTVEAGWHCNSLGCKPECGDGLLRGDEACDDNNALGGDGCSSGCKTEPFYNCTQASPSVCTTSITCGNSMVEPGEVCDPPGQNGCKAGCKSFDPDTTSMAVCGNNKIEAGETCEPKTIAGCDDSCHVEAGWTCPQAGVCFRNPACGDNIVQSAQGEGCDPPAVGNGCSAACKVEAGWTCVGLGPSTCVKPTCGNGVIEPGEKCDDGNANTTDGCSACAITTGWACPAQGVPCVAKCGDGIKVGIEQCDDTNLTSGDGCNAGCKVEVGFKCPTVGAACVASVCGDKVVDAGEGCDDGGLCLGGSVAGTACTKNADCTGGGLCKTLAGDGCGPTCQPEPTVTVGPTPTVNVFCGDGLKTGTEVCDDGNTTDGDGCQADCKSVTTGWTCTGKVTLPTSLQMQVTYRDFKKRTSSGGHPDFEHDGNPSASLNIPGPACQLGNTQCTAAAGATCAAGTCGWLDAQGKPIFHQADNTAEVTNENTFSLWYRDTNPAPTINGDNGAIQISKSTSSVTLNQVGGVTSEVYEYDNSNFFPLTGLGFGNDGNSANFHFTTELRYFFQYKGGEKLTFRGDDDVWVYINGRLAVDVGGVHCAELGQVILGDEDSSCSLHRADYTGACGTTGDPAACALTVGEQADTTDNRFGLTKGEVYEIVLFHAERHTSESNFRLTLAGFLAPRSSCETLCGDAIVAGDEFCDDGDATHGNGNSDTVSGACNTTCTARAYCGDGTRQLPGEACDNGTNTDLYKTATSPTNVCAPGCKVPAFCGDNALQAGQGEQCDKGGQNNDASYGPTSCTTACKLGGYCGDGTQQAAGGEACDLGANNGQYGASSCGFDCQPGPRCGDSIRNGPELCDDGVNNGTATSNCATNCTIKPYCGDGIKQNNEECDYGQFASTEYGGCTEMCIFGPKCGDGGPGIMPDMEEECDNGTAGNTGGYNGCTNKCGLGPRCGDAVLQSTEGEACDNGFNADDYDDPKTAAAECGPNCTPPPFCGDKVVQSSYELCDNGADNSDTAYEGCTTLCEFGPFCGDGDVSGPEVCDDGFDNVSYAAVKGGCSYDCQPAPYCGDGERNGPEQCDLGVDANTGEYGTCNEDCSFAPRCGDRKKNGNEQCDDGPTGSLSCTPSCKKRVVVQ